LSNEITVGWVTGKTLTYGVYLPTGVVRTAAGTALTEVAGTGFYRASNSSIRAGDFVIVREGTLEIMQGEYQPEVTSVLKVLNVVDERK